MLTRTHFVFSVAVAFLAFYVLEISSPIVFFSSVLVATVFVDIDSKNSWLGKHFCFRLFQFFVRHRGIFHSVFFGILVSLVVGIFSVWACFGFFVGYVSHLFLDGWTKSGVRPFWPFEFKIKGFVKTSGILEEIIFVFLLLFDIFLFGKVVFGYLFSMI